MTQSLPCCSAISFEYTLSPAFSSDVTSFLAKQAVKAVQKLGIRVIITDSFSGKTARNVAAFRSKHSVLAMCYREKTMRLLALSYGIRPLYLEKKEKF